MHAHTGTHTHGDTHGTWRDMGTQGHTHGDIHGAWRDVGTHVGIHGDTQATQRHMERQGHTHGDTGTHMGHSGHTWGTHRNRDTHRLTGTHTSLCIYWETPKSPVKSDQLPHVTEKEADARQGFGLFLNAPCPTVDFCGPAVIQLLSPHRCRPCRCAAGTC